MTMSIIQANAEIRRIYKEDKDGGYFDNKKGCARWPKFTRPWILDDDSRLYVTPYYCDDTDQILLGVFEINRCGPGPFDRIRRYKI